MKTSETKAMMKLVLKYVSAWEVATSKDKSIAPRASVCNFTDETKK